jgi:PhoPQ-activated pathogenicity-related protein
MIRLVFKSVLVVVLLLTAGLLHAQQDGSLKDYVYRNDPAYSYQLVGQLSSEEGFTAYFLNMNSQNWRTEEEVTPTLWNHWVTLIVPDQLTTNTANLTIVGGNFSETPPVAQDLALFVQLATATGSIQVVVNQVPGQKLQFPDLDVPVREDDLVAYSWRKSMESGDPTWAAYLPMTKAVVRTMDSAQDFIATLLGQELQSFIVSGFSKRGATAWLTAAVDPRVVAVVPGVFNVLHMAEQFEHHFNSYGFYSQAVASYEENEILQNIRSPEGRQLEKLIDPISYRQALTMPHLLLNATGDEFFLPDASEFYIHDIPGETLQRIVANTDHSMENRFEETLLGLIAWYQVQLYGLTPPKIEWRQDESGELLVSSDQIPLVAKLWQATNPNARDFRLEILGDQAWTETVINPTDEGRYHVSVPQPTSGWSAYMVELTFPGMSGIPQTYTTSVFVTPDEKPFEVEDPLGKPKRASYWQRQVKLALAGRPSDYDLHALQGMLPIRVLGQYIRDTETLGSYLNQWGAKRSCTAARLNVEAEQQGWNTTLYAVGERNIKFWQSYQLAEHLYEKDRQLLAVGICQALTRQ